MASTVFVNNQAPAIDASWLNDVNTTVYTALAGATTPAAAAAAINAVVNGGPASVTTLLASGAVTVGSVVTAGLVDGRDVSVDGAKLDTIAPGAGPSSNSFVNIAVATQGTVIATSPTDTLTLTAGANIGITTTPGTDTIAFAVTGTVPSAANSNTVGGLTPTQFARVDAVSNFTSVPTILNQTVWTAGNDGAGSGLDADTVDGLHASQITSNNIAINTGTVLHGGTIFPPSGYTVAECKFMVSMALNSYSESHNGGLSFQCSITAITGSGALVSVFHTNPQFGDSTGVANYIVIGKH